jgi:hypothetical protein
VSRWLYHIDAPKLHGAPCFGLVVEGGLVVEAPPIARWAEGRPVGTVVCWYLERGATVQATEIVHRVDWKEL